MVGMQGKVTYFFSSTTKRNTQSKRKRNSVFFRSKSKRDEWVCVCVHEKDSIDGECSLNFTYLHKYLSTIISLCIGCQMIYTITNCVYVYNLYGPFHSIDVAVVVVTFLKGIYIHVPINTMLNVDGERKKGLFSVLAFLSLLYSGGAAAVIFLSFSEQIC